MWVRFVSHEALYVLLQENHGGITDENTLLLEVDRNQNLGVEPNNKLLDKKWTEVLD